MPDDYFQLSREDRLEVLRIASDASGRPTHLLEKDIWVVWCLDVLFRSPFGDHLVFKGGTSLSKAYQAIDRFSEDIDITYDIRAIMPELDGVSDPLPPSPSQERKWTRKISEKLPLWIRETVTPALHEKINELGDVATIEIDGENLILAYNALQGGSGYIKPRVLVEFGARSTGEPAEEKPISCDAAPHVESVAFPNAKPRVMKAERTFWEKATAGHVFCHQEHMRGERFARHWFDLVRLDDKGFADLAFGAHDIAIAVAKHKGMFFKAKDKFSHVVNYEAAISGSLQLIPAGDAEKALASDYQHMVDDGMLYADPEPFGDLLERCHDLQTRANATVRVEQISAILEV